MDYAILILGFLLLLAALNVKGFFKLILWGISVAVMLYALPKVELMSGIPEEERIGASLLVIGITQISASLFEFKFMGETLFREVTDVVIQVLGVGLFIAGLCMAAFFA